MFTILSRSVYGVDLGRFISVLIANASVVTQSISKSVCQPVDQSFIQSFMQSVIKSVSTHDVC